MTWTYNRPINILTALSLTVLFVVFIVFLVYLAQDKKYYIIQSKNRLLAIFYQARNTRKDEIYEYNTFNQQYGDETEEGSIGFPVISVPWGEKFRAYKTLPTKMLKLAPSKIPRAGLGIFATTFIRKYTWLGEYEGVIISQRGKATDYSWGVYRESDDEWKYYIDGESTSTSNWLRWVNCARHVSEENVEMRQRDGRIFYVTNKNIHPEQELLIYYGDWYAKQLKIDVDNYEVEKPSNEGS